MAFCLLVSKLPIAKTPQLDVFDITITSQLLALLKLSAVVSSRFYGKIPFVDWGFPPR